MATRRELKDRLDAISDLRGALHKAGTNKSNLEREVKRILNELDEQAVIDAEAGSILWQVELDAIASDNAERLLVKNSISDINSSSKPPWEKRLLRRLVRDTYGK